MLSAGIKVYAESSPDEESLPFPDPDGLVVLVTGGGWRITLHLGDVATLRDMAAQAGTAAAG